MEPAHIEHITSLIRDVPDFPKEGIVFKDITPVLSDRQAFGDLIRHMCNQVSHLEFSRILGIESRGFIFAAAMAQHMNMGISLVRKKGKLPWKTVSQEYDLEYGSDIVEMHEDAVKPGENVIIVDDLLATGGTMRASIDLVAKFDAKVVGTSFFIELGFLNGRDKFDDTPVATVVTY